MTLVMAIVGSVARVARGVLGSVSWREMPVVVRVLVGILLALLAMVVIQDTMSWLDVLQPVYEIQYNAVLVGSAVLCVARGVLGRGERIAWTLLGIALAMWAGGNLYWQFALSDLEEAPYPSFADALWLGFLPVCYVAVVLLARSRMPRLDARLWLDGVIAALTTGAVSAAVVFGAVHESTDGWDTAAVWTNLAYPLGDMILLGTVIGAMAAGRGRLDRSWLYFGAGVAVFAVTDSIYLLQIAEGTYVLGTPLDTGWPLGTLLMALAAWQPAVRRRATGDELPSILTPIALALVSLGVLVYDHFDRINLLALGLATAALAAALIRLSLTHRESRANLVSTRRQARTDALTGLGNRFELQRALDDALAEPRPHLLVMFDLDGFKNYNDSYGHPAGDALLARLGSRLGAATAATGGAYRVGGDEFCVLAPWPADQAPEALIERGRAALSERGEGFKIGASAGHAALPGDAVDADEALRVADRRLYAEKNSARVSARLQSAGVLRSALSEWDPELGGHADDVVEIAVQVARYLDLDEDEIERVAIAAELHDIGKIAIPRSILAKAGPLDADEWTFMRRHTLIGERIAQSAPALGGIATLIRSSHERWDGTGYPDRLAGDEIPLGAQIVFVCDAYAAMTSDRCYAPAKTPDAAQAELLRHAGTQFAPAVVDAFLATRAAHAIAVS